MTVSCVALAVALVGAACGDDGGENAPPDPTIRGALTSDRPGDATVEVTARGYEPRTVRMQAGGEITWLNTGIRRVTAETGIFRSDGFDTHTIYRGQAKSAVLEKPGRYRYFSAYDSQTFRGVVIVEPADSGTDAR